MAAADHPVRRRRSRSVEVQEAVKDLILARRLASGDPLPTESELMRELGISRNSVREALKGLQAVASWRSGTAPGCSSGNCRSAGWSTSWPSTAGSARRAAAATSAT